MMVKEACKIILGAELTAKERHALDIEVRKAAAEMARKHADEVDAILLWWLREKLGFGYERLKQFHHDFAKDGKTLDELYRK